MRVSSSACNSVLNDESENSFFTESRSLPTVITVPSSSLASWAFDRGEYPLTKRNAEHALEIDPECATAKEFVRLADECAGDTPREQFAAQWRAIMKDLEVAALPTYVPPQITQVGVSEDNEVPLFSSIYAFEGQSTGVRFHDVRDLVAPIHDFPGQDVNLAPSKYVPPQPEPPSNKPGISELLASVRENVPGAERAVIQPKSNVLVVRADPATQEAIVRFLSDAKGRGGFPAAKPKAAGKKVTATDMVALFRDLNAGAETQREGSGLNRNSYRETDKGFQSTCRVRGKDGRWIPLTRDWTAK